MTNTQFLPLELNPQTGEPFLRLRKHKNIIITPPRQEDTKGYVTYLNDPKVHEWLKGPPHPYLPEHAEDFFKIIKAKSDKFLSEITSAPAESDPVFVSGCPVRAIREVKEDGTDEYIGDIGIHREADARFLVLPKRDEATEEEKEQAVKRNAELPVADENIVYMIGGKSNYRVYYLAPSHHGRGIMSDALDTLLWDWAVPRMGVRKIRASTFEGNIGSVRVFEKNGFKLTQTLDNFIVVKGKMRNLNVLQWQMNDQTILP